MALLVFSMTLFIAGCLIPEKFNAGFNVKRKGGYSFRYDGVLTFVPALSAARQGNLKPEDDAAL
jgi:hypothetical protein